MFIIKKNNSVICWYSQLRIVWRPSHCCNLGGPLLWMKQICVNHKFDKVDKNFDRVVKYHGQEKIMLRFRLPDQPWKKNQPLKNCILFFAKCCFEQAFQSLLDRKCLFLPELHYGALFLGPVKKRGDSDCTIFDTYVTFFDPRQLLLVEFLLLTLYSLWSK